MVKMDTISDPMERLCPKCGENMGYNMTFAHGQVRVCNNEKCDNYNKLIPESYRCPEDADNTPNYRQCMKMREGRFCTRKRNHKGEHHAHGENGNCMLIWED
jgi:hypothetical protein